MFALKPISPESVPSALAKAEHYRLLNEPAQAESICRDILEIEPEHQHVLICMILALTDQIPVDPKAWSQALSTVNQLRGEYDRAYYAGIVWERRAKARHHLRDRESNLAVYEWVVKALKCFEEAEGLRPHGNDDAILRWNTCVRFLQSNPELKPAREDTPEPILSE